VTLVARFDTDTALAPAGEGAWTAHIDPSWFVVSGPNGGLLTALATRALAELTDRPPRSLTVHYLEAPAEGELEIRARIEREGATTVSASVSMHQRGRTVALGLAACAHWREGQPEWDDARMPEMPPPRACEPFPSGVPELPPYLRKYEIRWTGLDGGARPATVRAWLRPADPRPVDPVLLAALADAMMPPSFLRMPERLFVPTIDLSVHWRGLPPEGGHPWVLGSFTTRVSAGGVCEEDGELWSEDGRLLVQSRQLAIVRRPR